MKSYLLLLVALVAQMVAAKEYPYKSSFYGCPKECHTEKGPKCEISIPHDRLFAAIPPHYFGGHHSKFCGNNYVGMIIDDKADSNYKIIRAKIIDQCGSCAKTQIDLSQDAFERIADPDHGIVSMVYVFVNKEGEIVEGPVYSSSALEHFAKKKGVSKSTILGSFKEAARNLSKKNGTGMKQYPWVSGEFKTEDDGHEEHHEEHHTKKTTTKKTTTKKTTTTTKKTTTTTTTKTTTTTSKKTLPPFTKPKITTFAKHTTVAPIPVPKPSNKPVVPVVPIVPGGHTRPNPNPVDKPVHKPVDKPADKPAEKPKDKSKPKHEEEEKKPEPKLVTETEKEVDEPVTARVIGGFGAVLGAAGVGLLLLKRKSPQKYDDLKQKFPEAFGTVKRSLTRGASTIKRGVSRSVSRSGRNFQRRNEQAAPLPASYTFTLSSEDGLPRVALYDDPYPTKTHGTQHW